MRSSSLKVLALSAELLAAICILSPREGHKSALAALSDFRVAFNEGFRFESLINGLHLPDVSDDVSVDEVGLPHEEDGTWEVRAAVMALLNAIANSPDSLEDRIALREEYSRRGLNEAIVVCHTGKSDIQNLTVRLVLRLYATSNRRILF